MADSAVIAKKFWILGERVPDSGQWPKLLPAIAKKLTDSTESLSAMVCMVIR